MGIERLARLALGVALIVNEGFIRPAAQTNLLATGLTLLAAPDLIRLDMWLSKLRAIGRAEQEQEKESAP